MVLAQVTNPLPVSALGPDLGVDAVYPQLVINRCVPHERHLRSRFARRAASTRSALAVIR